MRDCWASMILLVAAATALAGEERDLASASRLAKQQPGMRTLWATSGRCVGLERRAACQEAEQKARQQLLGEIGKLAETLIAGQLPPQRLVEEQAWLLSQSGVERKDELTVDEKPYGPVAEYSIRITLPEAVVTEWAARLARQRRGHILRMLSGAGGTLLGWFAGFVLLVRLDRATGGYYRGVLVPVAVVVLLAASVIGWVWLIAAV